MAFYKEQRTFLDRDLFRGSEGKNYLKSPALENLKDEGEYPRLNRLFRNGSDWKDLFESMVSHLDPAKGLTYGGFLLAVGDLYERGRLKRYQIEEYILKDVFPEGLSNGTKSEYLYRDAEPEADGERESEDKEPVKRNIFEKLLGI